MSLVEAALLLALAGVALAVFVPTFAKRLRASKIAEAPAMLEQLFAATAAYYEARHGQDGHLQRCLPPEAGPTPETPSQEPATVEFASETMDGHATWAALGFEPDRPIRYRYRFLPAAAGCNLVTPPGMPIVTLIAEGDLDGDGILSTFERVGAANAQGKLESLGILHVHNRVE